MTAIIDAARAAIVSGVPTITVDPRNIVALGDDLARLEARAEELQRRYEPTETATDALERRVRGWVGLND
jgi:hypothetical protein